MRLAKARVHFIGVGGIGMCGLAELLHNMGVNVKGSDQAENAQTLHLRELGIRVQIGHQPNHLDDVDVAVYSSAIKPSNPEYQAAKKNGIPLIPRAEALAEIMRLRRGIAVAGTHGKTTTTSMAATVFIQARLDPTIVVGGRLDLIKSTAKLGAGEWLIAEADESDGSFNRLSPEIAIVTNIDDDHLDHFGSIKNLETAFYEFASRVPFYGVAVVCGDGPKIKDIFKDFPKRIAFYGFDQSNDYVLEGQLSRYRILHQGQVVGEFRLSVPGRHNALNALAAILAGHLAGTPIEKCCRAIEHYAGVERRFQKKASVRGVDYYDDYGHHPTEVRAVLSAFKEQHPDRRVVVLFQPHRFSRTEACWKEFLNCFQDANHVFMLDIYSAGESQRPGITGKRLCDELDHSSKEFVADKQSAIAESLKFLKDGDIFLTLGAGDVWRIGEEIYLRANE